MTKWKIGLVVLGLMSAIGCGDSDSSDGDDGANGAANGGATSSGANATTGADDAGGSDNGGGASATGGDSATGGTNATGGTTAGTTTGGQDAGATTGATGDACKDDTTVTGACKNTCDTAKLATFDPGATAGGCGMSCIADDGCKTCYDKDPNFSKVSPSCRTCWVKITRCVADKCVLGGTFPCLTDANSKACADCRTTNCNAEFTKCSGLDPEAP